LRSNRVAARAELGKDPSSLEKFKSDVRLTRKNGWVDDVEAQKALRWARTASKRDLSNGRRWRDHVAVYATFLSHLREP
jgi:hypothetical protein